jgi:hypothetical protein
MIWLGLDGWLVGWMDGERCEWTCCIRRENLEVSPMAPSASNEREARLINGLTICSDYKDN